MVSKLNMASWELSQIIEEKSVKRESTLGQNNTLWYNKY